MTTLIIGAAGKTGRRIVERLEARDVVVRPASRATGFDWHDPSTWPAMVEGIDAAYISYHPDITVPGAPEAIAAFSKLAAAHGVKRLVLLSGRGESEAQRAERLMQAAGTEWTDRALQLVRAELQRGVHGRRRARGRGRRCPPATSRSRSSTSRTSPTSPSRR